MQLLIPKWFRLDNKIFCVRYAISKELTHYSFLLCCTEVVFPNQAHFWINTKTGPAIYSLCEF